MNKLFENAILSIQLGIEDYESDNPTRAISAVRNFYAGVLLLAKEVLVQKAAKDNPQEVISKHYKPKFGGDGFTYVPASPQTIGFSNLGVRFKDFDLTVDQSALNDLSRIRNNLEHYYSDTPHETVREAIAKAFPVVVQLFSMINKAPSESLGNSWQAMLRVRDFYETELESRKNSFGEIEWHSGILARAGFTCPMCQSELVMQDDPKNTELESIKCHCRACGYKFEAEDAVRKALESHFEFETYIAATEGGEYPFYNSYACLQCGYEGYLVTSEETGCVWCGFTLEECARCGVTITPENVAADTDDLCDYCNHMVSKY